MQEQQEREPLSTPAILTIIVLCLLGLGAIVLFGWQTWEFVDWLLPSERLLMKILAVLNFDGFSYVWLAAGLFLARILQSTTRSFTLIAGIVDFVLSLACTVIQMTLQSAERFFIHIDPNVVYLAYAVIVIALVINITTLMAIVHIELPILLGLPPKPKKRRRFFAQAQTTAQERTFSSAEVQAMLEAVKSGQKAVGPDTSPLAEAPSPAKKASQNGASQNGK